MQLAKELCNYGTVLYLSYEEGVSLVISGASPARADERGSRPLPHCSGDSYADLVERLRRPKSAKFVIIDSFQDSKLTFEEVEELIARFHRKSFIFISQEYKGQPMGKPAGRLRYKAGLKVRVSGYKAFCQGRFTGNPDSYYVVWEEGILRTSNNLG